MPKSRFAPLGIWVTALAGSAAGQWTEIEEAKLVASDAAPSDQFGTSVALEGDTLVVGAPGCDVAGLADVGAAYVFVKGSAGWGEVQKLTPAVPAAGDAFGTSVAIDAGRILIGAPLRDIGGKADRGAAEVFTWNGASWTHAQELTVPSSGSKPRFGFAVALDGDTALCGAPSNKFSPAGSQGQAFFFVESSGSWSHLETMTSTWPTNSWGTEFGAAVALEGDRAVVGAPAWGNGPAVLFRRSGATWVLDDLVYPRGLNPSGYNASQYGISVALSGDSLLVGAPMGWVSPWSPWGTAQVYELGGAGWSWEAGFVKNTPPWSGEFGDSVALAGNLAAIGAPAMGPGVVIVRGQSGETWSYIANLKASDGTKDDRFGDAVALEGERAIVGVPLHKSSDEGAVYGYALVAPPPATYCTPGTSASGCTPALTTTGQASATAPSGFVIGATGVEGQRNGMLVYGTAGKQALPWGSGTSYFCIVPPLSYGGTLPGTGTLGHCDGSFAVDLNALWCPTCPKASTNPGESASVQAQVWYRDPQSTSNQATSLSNAIEFVIGA